MARDLIPPSSPAGRPAPDGTPACRARRPERVALSVAAADAPRRCGTVAASATASGSCSADWGASGRRGAGRDRRPSPPAASVPRLRPGAELVQLAAVRHDPRGWRRTDRREGRGGVPPPGRRSAGRRSRRGPLGHRRRAARAVGTSADFANAQGVIYELDGLGPLKSISGQGSEERLQLIQREALELALYTFRYLPEVEQVVTMLPPPPPTEEQRRAAAKAEARTMAQAAVARRAAAATPEDIMAAQAATAKADKNATDTARRGPARDLLPARATSSSSCRHRCRPRCRRRAPSRGA